MEPPCPVICSWIPVVGGTTLEAPTLGIWLSSVLYIQMLEFDFPWSDSAGLLGSCIDITHGSIYRVAVHSYEVSSFS